MEDSPELIPNPLIERAKHFSNRAFFGAVTLGSAFFGIKYGYQIGELVSPELDGTLGEIVEHGLEITTAVGAGAISGAIGAITAIWIVDDGLIDFMEGE